MKTLILILVMFFVSFMGYAQEETVRVGDTWVWENNDPFNPIKYEYKVLEIRVEHVQYLITKSPNKYIKAKGDTLSGTLSWFVVGAYRKESNITKHKKEN